MFLYFRLTKLLFRDYLPNGQCPELVQYCALGDQFHSVSVARRNSSVGNRRGEGRHTTTCKFGPQSRKMAVLVYKNRFP